MAAHLFSVSCFCMLGDFSSFSFKKSFLNFQSVKQFCPKLITQNYQQTTIVRASMANKEIVNTFL